MNSWGKWSTCVAVGAMAAALSVAAFNVVIDPYSVLKTNEGMRPGYNPNERFRKIEFLKGHVGQFDSFVLGASTMGLFPNESLNSMRPEGRWYNMSFLAGTPPEALRALKYLKAKGMPIHEVVYGLDMFAFRKLGAHSELWRREHPEITGESNYSWMKRHIFASTLMDGTERLTHNWLNSKPKLVFDFDGTGRYYLARWDREIEQDHKAFIQRQIYDKFNLGDKKPKPAGVALVQERFDELAELKKWLDENRIVSHFWINPIHWKNLATVDERTLAEFRSGVKRAIGDVPDYTLRKDVYSRDDLFYEWQHFRPQAASLILREVLSPAHGSQAVASAGGALAQ
ncbi:MAG: hypothetical protein E6R08_00705 [Nevskiaceae bacterium]|nr:MAG: hypothetical protein E6R08_00705 [Nevskiaceae bacterium]